MHNSSTKSAHAMLCPVALALAALIVQPHLRAATTADYVQDGLLACWDGVENAGAGLHDAAPSKWIDVVGGGRSHSTASRPGPTA